MKLIFIILLWAIIAAILAVGVVMAVHGTFWLLIVGILCFVGAITKYGILSH
jgi:hypothetical protein